MPESRFTGLDGRNTSLLLRYLMQTFVTQPENKQNKTPDSAQCGSVGRSVGASPKGGGLIPCQGTYLGCRSDPLSGQVQEQPTSVSVSLLSLPLSEIKLLKKESKHA